MSALTVDLMGGTPMDEATIQARAQDIIAANWPAWKRERALRLGDVAALNAYMDEIASEVDLARYNSALLAEVLVIEAGAEVEEVSQEVQALLASRAEYPLSRINLELSDAPALDTPPVE